MTLTLTLTPERQARLQEQARAAGLPLDEYALRVLDGGADTSPRRLGADLIAQWEQEGAFLPDSPHPDRADSPDLARQLRAQAWDRS